jgi:prepilin-type N-terminal cleavage/methylation domain-containing protein
MRPDRQAFTLVELSVVLVVIALLVGGVIVGRDLVRAAMLRAQVSQFERFDAAVKSFRLKYDALPGDLANARAQGFGLSYDTAHPTHGDGNGLINDYLNRVPIVDMHAESQLLFIQHAHAGHVEGRFLNVISSVCMIG